MVSKRSILVSTVLLVIILTLSNFQLGQAAPESTPLEQESTPPPTSDLVYQAEPGPDTPTLQEITAGAITDAEAVQRSVEYFNANRERLRILWREENETRLAGLFAMYVVHISHIYGESPYPDSLLGFMTLERMHCGISSLAQAQLVDGLGLRWRRAGFTSGWHAWIEVFVNGEWEVFDSTTNLWINRPGEAMLRQEPRAYRAFYTPLFDPERPDARIHLQEGYNMQKLWADMRNLGLSYNPPGDLVVTHASDDPDRPELWLILD